LKCRRSGVSLLVLVFSLIPSICAGQPDVPKNGYVPDESTAVGIAQAVFVPIYGRSRVKAEGPFHARLDGNHWIVNGTLHKPRKSGLIVMGGTMTAEIDKATGRILDVFHAK
jgi:hypothetical protein